MPRDCKGPGTGDAGIWIEPAFRGVEFPPLEGPAYGGADGAGADPPYTCPVCKEPLIVVRGGGALVGCEKREVGVGGAWLKAAG